MIDDPNLFLTLSDDTMAIGHINRFEKLKKITTLLYSLLTVSLRGIDTKKIENK